MCLRGVLFPMAVRSTIRSRFGANLRKLRTGKGLTQEELASKAGLAARHLQKLEAGSVNATLDTLDRLSGALDVSPELFLRE